MIMSSNKIEYKVGEAKHIDIVEHLKTCDSSFSPVLSSYVNIEDYSKKIKNNAVTFEAWIGNELVGLIACYLNDKENLDGYITNVSILEIYSARGIGKQLLINCEKYSSNQNFKSLSLEVEASNDRAISLYSKNSFALDRKVGGKYRMSKRINDIEPLVSICCATFNHGNYIRETLEGFMMQKTSFPFEILIHDDASTDETSNIIKEFELRHPSIIKPIYQIENQHSKGVSISVTFNFPRTKGKYIAMCEGDDYWTDPKKLQKQIDFLEANDDYVITYHNAKIINDKKDIINESKLSDNLKKDFMQGELIKGVMLLTLTVCYRNIIKKYPEEYFKVKNGDKFLTSLLGNYGKGKYIGDIEDAVYRKHENSIWSSLNKINQMYYNGDTRAWLSRYYKRIGKEKYATYFGSEVVNHFNNLIYQLSSSKGTNNEIIKVVFNNYTDIINSAELEKFSQLLSPRNANSNINKQSNEMAELNSILDLPSLEEAELLISQNKLSKAKLILKLLQERDPNNTNVLNDLAVISIMEENSDDAIIFINNVLSIDPKNEIALENFNYLIENFNIAPLEEDHLSDNGLVLKVGNEELFSSVTMTINWVVTRKCNYTCSYCRVFDNSGNFTSFEHFKNAIDQIAKLNRTKYKIVLTGGEPTIHPQYSELLYYMFEKLGERVTIITITNLGRTEKYFLNLLNKIKGFEKNISFVVSFHTEFASENNFVNNAKLISEKGFPIRVQIMAHPEKMKQIHYLDKEFKKIKNKNLNYQIMVIRENYGSVPDKRYSSEDLLWLQSYYSAQTEAKTILIETKELNSSLNKNYYSAPEINAKGINNFKGMLCMAGVNNFSINTDGKIDRAVCFRGQNINAKNIYFDKNALEGMNEPIICPFERCGCTADIPIPKWREDA